MEKETMLSIKDVAKTLSISENTVRRWIAEGKIKGLKFGRQWRFRPSDMAQWLEHGDQAGNKSEEKKRISLMGLVKGGNPITGEEVIYQFTLSICRGRYFSKELKRRKEVRKVKRII